MVVVEFMAPTYKHRNYIFPFCTKMFFFSIYIEDMKEVWILRHREKV